jgi:hypothetical protein
MQSVMPYSHGIIAEVGSELAASPYPDPVQADRVVWRGKEFNRPRYAAEWMELLDADDQCVGVHLDMVQDLHPTYWQWLHQFRNVSFTERGDARILFSNPATPVRTDGPYLPVEAYESHGGGFVLYVPELLKA